MPAFFAMIILPTQDFFSLPFILPRLTLALVDQTDEQ
jgi:hypothetical protein